MARSATNWSHLSLTAIAFIIAGCSAVLTGVFGSSFGGEEPILVAICFLIFFCISLLSPILFKHVTTAVIQRNVVKIIVLGFFAVVFFVNDVVTNGGTIALFRQTELVDAGNQNDKAKNARKQVYRIEKRIAEIRSQTAWQTTYLAPASYDAEVRRLKNETERNRNIWKRSKQCTDTTAETSKKVCQGIATAEANKANALHRQTLKTEMVTLERELKEAKVLAAETPTQASAALEHAGNIAAAYTRQMDPSREARFWANYGLSAWGGLATSLAAIASAILLGISSSIASRHRHEFHAEPQEARNPYLPDMRPAPPGESLSQTFVLQEGDGIEAMRLALQRLADRNRVRATS